MSSGKMITTFAVLFILSVFGLQPLQAVPCASWPEAEKSLKGIWPTKYPGETILKLVQNGEPTQFEKMEPTGKEKIDEHGDRYEYLVKVIYCRVPAKATIQRGGGSQVVFDVSAIFKQNGKSYAFFDVGVGGSSEVAASGQEAPTKDAIKKLVADLWIQTHPGHKVEKVALSDPELKKDSSAGRWWYNVGADIFIVNENGEKQKCTNDYTTVYKGEKGKEGVDSTGNFKVYFLDTPSCE